MDNISPGDKACTTCSTVLPNTAKYFARHKTSKGGLTAQCKACINATKQRWAAENPEKVRAYSREWARQNRDVQTAWAKANPDKVKAYAKKRYEANPEAVLETRRRYNRTDGAKASKEKWVAANREQYLQAKREYYQRNKEKWREYEKKDPVRTRRLKAESAKRNPEAQRTKCRNRYARLKNAPGLHTVAEIKQMYECQKGLCAYCEVELNGTYHVDHMTPITREGRNDWTNLAITCATCNSSKSAKTAEEFFASRKG